MNPLGHLQMATWSLTSQSAPGNIKHFKSTTFQITVLECFTRSTSGQAGVNTLIILAGLAGRALRVANTFSPVALLIGITNMVGQAIANRSQGTSRSARTYMAHCVDISHGNHVLLYLPIAFISAFSIATTRVSNGARISTTSGSRVTKKED